jgi:hypothetical protein
MKIYRLKDLKDQRCPVCGRTPKHSLRRRGDNWICTLDCGPIDRIDTARTTVWRHEIDITVYDQRTRTAAIDKAVRAWIWG